MCVHSSIRPGKNLSAVLHCVFVFLNHFFEKVTSFTYPVK